MLIEKPSVLTLPELDQLQRAAEQQHHVLAKVVYHKLFDPDHKKLRTLVVDQQLQHVNSGYCSLARNRSRSPASSSPSGSWEEIPARTSPSTT